MKCNIKKRFFLVFLSLLPVLGWAQTGVLNGPVDLGRTLKDFSTEAGSPAAGPWYILEGSVGNIFIQDADPASFVGVVELVQGEWQGTENIIDRRGYLVFKGKDFADKILEKRPRTPQPDKISPHRRLLAAVKYTGHQEVEPGKPVPVFVVGFVRFLD